MSEVETLRKKVFENCDDMEVEGIKITREAVRQRTGGSDRDLSRYIGEWRDSKALVVQGKEAISQIPDEEIKPTPASTTTISRADIEQIKSNAVQRVKALRIAEIQVARAYQENPNLLPSEILEEINQAEMAAIATPLNHRNYYDPNALAQMVIASL
jgi:Plasmid replication region DNA-binding N-term